MEIIFVYNADSDILSQAKDFINKALSPETYACNLCKITYGTAVMKQEWRDFIENSDFEIKFLHRDEFRGKYLSKSDVELPAAFRHEGGEIETIITAHEINSVNNIQDLKKLVESVV